jgi:hypothetical protein
MHYSFVTVVVSLVSIMTVVCILTVWQYPVTPREAPPPLLVNVSSVKVATEADDILTVTTVRPEYSTHYDVSTALYLNTVTERSQIDQSNGTSMQRDKIKEVVILSSRVKRDDGMETVMFCFCNLEALILFAIS